MGNSSLSSNSSLSRRWKSSLLAALLVGAVVAASPEPVFAASAPVCVNQLQSSAFSALTGCTDQGRSGGGGLRAAYSGGDIKTHLSHTVCDPNKLPACVEIPCPRAQNGIGPIPIPGYLLDSAIVYTNGTVGPFVQLCWADTAGPTTPDITAQVVNLIPPATINTAWKDHFLVNTDIDFSLANGNGLTKSLVIGGVTVVLNSTPKSYVWDFGDGSPTVTTANPTHRWTNTSPDPAHPADHNARVTLTVVWGNQVVQGGGPAQNLGNITRTAQIVRPIDEVVSVPTELNQ